MIKLVHGDITKIPADLIVNAANSDLCGGGGVDGAIHRAGGPDIMKELNRVRPMNGCPTGAGVVTSAGNLPAKHVFHAVGPIWRGGGYQEAELLADTYRAAIGAAEDLRAEAVSFPSISTGAYGFPVERAAPIALSTVRAHFVGRATFVLFDEKTLKAYQDALACLRQD